MEQVVYLSPAELAAMLRDHPSDVTIVDVRGNDYEGGHIPNSLNIPADQLAGERLEALAAYVRARPHLRHIVFHCLYSKQRGPKAAAMWCRSQASGLPHVQAHVLRGGFEAWAMLYRKQPGMIADYLPEKWAWMDAPVKD
ncbi:putative Dual specificity phosphatase ibp1 [Paratrimastix pyriformis]|uniref:Dual specificity phosphatase ibp1 n=1 Tax=Paratrimastix pyriformis TaxID=342808 RepID=A0ABQ8UFI3_9EUKA|nr:putative Dual specificity phosphatase ibp1 [Paratrimastix pyriformis]